MGTGQKTVNCAIGICMEEELMAVMGAILTMVAPIRHGIFAVSKGIRRPSDSIKNPEKASECWKGRM